MEDMTDSKGKTEGENSVELRPPKISRDQIDRLWKVMATPERLAGREVLIPAFGSDAAFFEGELAPETKANEEELVYVSTGVSQMEDNTTPVSLSGALEWLRQHSSTTAEPTKKLPATTASAASSKPKKSSLKASKTTRSSSATANAAANPAAAGITPMFNINEEYDANGNRIVGQAVNLSSRLQAVYGKDEDGNDDFHEDEKHNEDEETEESNKTPTAKVSDDEFDRISRRLEELALLEEEELRSEKLLKSNPRAASKKKSSASFGFKKGFLNASNNKKQKSPLKPATTASNTTTKTTTSSSTADPIPKKSTSAGGGVRIDTSQNRIHEIPREGRQQPVPQRAAPQEEELPRNSRLLDSSVFSGQISERTSSTISADTAARLAANEQTQSLQHELRQQQQERRNAAKPKRVSRFKQQRQQEQ